MPEERRRQRGRRQSHRHSGSERFQAFEQPRKPVAAVSQDVRLGGKAPSAGSPKSQARIQIAPFQDHCRGLGIQDGGRGEGTFQIAVQAGFKMGRFFGKRCAKCARRNVPRWSGSNPQMRKIRRV